MHDETHALFIKDLDSYGDSDIYVLAEYYGVIPNRDDIIDQLASAIISRQKGDMKGGFKTQSYFIDNYVEPQYEDQISNLDIDMDPSEFDDENAYDQYVKARDAYRQYMNLVNLYPRGVQFAEKYNLILTENLAEKLNRYDRITGKAPNLYGHIGNKKERIE